MLRPNAPILQETTKINLVRHPAKLSNIFAKTETLSGKIIDSFIVEISICVVQTGFNRLQDASS